MNTQPTHYEIISGGEGRVWQEGDLGQTWTVSTALIGREINANFWCLRPVNLTPQIPSGWMDEGDGWMTKMGDGIWYPQDGDECTEANLWCLAGNHIHGRPSSRYTRYRRRIPSLSP